MGIDELIERFLEETDYHNKDNVLAIMAYGSRVSGSNSDSSDLDILIVTSKGWDYRAARFVDGIPIDVTIMPVYKVEWSIVNSNLMGSTYFDSVLNNGKVVVDRFGTYEYLCSLLECKEKKRRKFDHSLYEEAEDYYQKFVDNGCSDEISYFSCLEDLRKLYHIKCGFSTIQASKVFELYSDRNRARDLYKLKLPESDFISDYLGALMTDDLSLRRKILEKFIGIVCEESPHEYDGQNYDFLIEQDINKRLVMINKNVWKCEDMLLASHPYARAFYNIILGDICLLYSRRNGKDLIVDFVEGDIEEMIRNLEKAFGALDDKKEIDFNDYILRW